mgnify:CR=1 FL=1
MYNRYMRNDDGTYVRVPEEEPGRRPVQSQPHPGGGQDHQDSREHASSQDHGSQGHSSSDGQGHPPARTRTVKATPPANRGIPLVAQAIGSHRPGRRPLV